MSIHHKAKDKHGRPGWEVVIRYRHNGKALRKAFVVRGTKSDARSFEAAKKVELEAGVGLVAPAAVPNFLNFCVDVYKPHAELHLKHTTWIKRTSQLATLMEFFGHLLLTNIGDAEIDDFKRLRRDAGLKKVSVNNELRVLRRVLTFARDERQIALTVPRIKFFTEGERRPKVWTENEVSCLFTSCAETSPALLPMLVFLANTGARRGEALALTWDRVDEQRRLVNIWPTDDEDDDEHDEGWEPKNKKPREVTIGDDLLPWLRRGRSKSKYVFPCPSTGERYAGWPQKQYERAQRKAGLSGGVHTLRHTFASHFLQNEPDIFLLAKILGHSHTRVTELYSHLLPDHLERGRNAVRMVPAIGPAALAARRRWKTSKVPSSKTAKTLRDRR